MKRIVVITALLANAVMNIAFAQTSKATSLGVYEEGIEFATLMCPMMLELANLNGNSDEPGKTNWPACIADAKKKLKSDYVAALKTVKKPSARAALKEHYIAATAAFTSMAPEPNEIKMNYTRRQAENKNKVTERWARFEIEN